MDRRELFKSVVAVAAAAGAEVKASSYDAPPEKPALVIIESDQILSNETCLRLMQVWKEGIEGTPLEGLKAIVLTDGLRLTILDANGHVLNRTVEDA